MTNYTFKKIKKYLIDNNIQFSSEIDENNIFTNINSISDAKEGELIFYNDSKYADLLKNTKASACLISKQNLNLLPNSCKPIIVENAYLAFTYLTNFFYIPILSNGIISKNSVIAKDSQIDNNVQINDFVSIKENVTLKQNVIISDNCVIGPNVTIENNTVINANSKISNCKIGKNCNLKSNIVIGERGFGFATSEKITFQHFGTVLIEDNVHIGSNTSIDRAAFGETKIGEGSRLDNLIQIGHNVKIGSNAVIAAQVGIAGSAIIGNNVIIGGQSGIAGHLKIGNNVMVAARSGVIKSVKDNSVVAGFPAIDIKKWKINTIKFNKLK